MSLSEKIAPTMRTLAQIQQSAGHLTARLMDYDTIHKASREPDGCPAESKALDMEIDHYVDRIKSLAKTMKAPPKGALPKPKPVEEV